MRKPIKQFVNPNTKQSSKVTPEMISSLLLPLGLFFLEILLQKTATNMHGSDYYLQITLIACGTGLVIETILEIIRSTKIRCTIRFIVLELFTLWFMISYFSDNSYRVFMDIASVFGGAGDVINEFGETLWTILTKGFPMIALYHIPSFFCMILFLLTKRNIKRKRTGILLKGLIGVFIIGLTLLMYFKDPYAYSKLTTDYNYDTSVRSLGMITSFVTDIKYKLFGNPFDKAFVDDDPIPDDSTPDEAPKHGSDTNIDSDEPEQDIIVYSRNEIEIDFDSLIESAPNNTLKDVYSYLSSRQGSYKNSYTGLFEGKNLILICAEAFSKEVIDPILTPTLYRMAYQGIYFEDYYQPDWGGSTSSGEFSMLTGIIPVEQVNSVYRAIGRDLRFCLGNQLRSMGYFSAGYHDGEYTYYDRHKTHTWFGYDIWMGRGNGMEKGCPFLWPESDLDMMKYTVPMYIDQEHFNIYYMTISGHANYSVSANAISDRNWDAVKDLDYSYAVRSYLAANLELEYAMEYLIGALEEAGKADDTVIVLTADHYPYGLEDSTAWATSGDCLADLYGYKADSNSTRDHNALIIWSGCLEDMDSIVVTEPTYSLDIVPTLSNLFGFEFDSRFLVGRDVFSDEMPLVIWVDHSWMTDKGYYDAVKNVFTPKDGVDVSEAYIEAAKNIVQNKFSYSKAIHEFDVYGYVFSAETG